MTYTYTIPSDIPAVILTMHEDFNFKTDMEKATPDALAILAKCSEPVFWVVHVLTSMNVEDLLLGTAEVSQGPHALWRHPMIREVLLVSSQPMLHISAAGFSEDAFGNLKVQIFENLDDALAYIDA